MFIGSRHIDPDTGLIYFKYDFGYEFGILMPGEGVPKDKNAPDDGEPFPVIHTKSAGAQWYLSYVCV